ncbi:phage portal protein [Desulfonatronum thioautotrophicum]|uniref:phage portal protein n=1 Tax=Desulfonatronum thioautotrophicum TaxID=617001 RepID=UPI0005EBF2F4|nr:phage portal protein [Desulfonatronum thioautotrophicum]
MIESQAGELVRSAFQAATRMSNIERKRNAAKRLDYYHDFQNEYIREQLQKHFSKPQNMSPCFINLTRKVINRLAMVYVEDARRIVEHGTERDQEILGNIERTTWLGAKWKLTNRYSKLLGMVLLRPVWRNNHIDVDLLTPDILDVVTGDSPEDIQTVLVTHYPSSGRNDETTYSVWTADQFQRLNYRGHVMENIPNPYRVIPFVPCWSRVPTDSVWCPGGDDLITIQESFNEKLTDLLYILRMQGFGLGYVKGMRGELGTVDPGSFVNLPEGGEVGFAKATAPISDTLAALDYLLKQAAVSNGLSASSLSTETREESGIARIVSNQELEELRRDDCELFRSYERRLFEKIRAVWNHHNPGRKISDKAELVVDFHDGKQVTDPSQQSEMWDRLLALGVLSPVDILMERNPDLTRDEAKARLVEIQDEIREFSGAV